MAISIIAHSQPSSESIEFSAARRAYAAAVSRCDFENACLQATGSMAPLSLSTSALALLTELLKVSDFFDARRLH
jgi:hypothetical protein